VQPGRHANLRQFFVVDDACSFESPLVIGHRERNHCSAPWAAPAPLRRGPRQRGRELKLYIVERRSPRHRVLLCKAHNSINKTSSGKVLFMACTWFRASQRFYYAVSDRCCSVSSLAFRITSRTLSTDCRHVPSRCDSSCHSFVPNVRWLDRLRARPTERMVTDRGRQQVCLQNTSRVDVATATYETKAVFLSWFMRTSIRPYRTPGVEQQP